MTVKASREHNPVASAASGALRKTLMDRLRPDVSDSKQPSIIACFMSVLSQTRPGRFFPRLCKKHITLTILLRTF